MVSTATPQKKGGSPSEKLPPMSQVLSMPHLQLLKHAPCEDFPEEFKEFFFKNEGFKVVPLHMECPVFFKELLETPSSIQGDWK